MAKYRFKCDNCSTSVERYVSLSTEVLSCKNCASNMTRQFPNVGSKRVTETVDSFLNVRHEDDQQGAIKNRREQHYWDVEVPRMVESGVYSIETMLENKWVQYNEKGQMVINNPFKKGLKHESSLTGD